MTAPLAAACRSDPGGYGRRAEAFIDSLRLTRQARDVIEALQLALQPFGFEFCAIGDLPSKILNRPQINVLVQCPPEWLRLYVERDYASADPVIHRCIRDPMPFAWSEARYDPVRQPRAREVMAHAADFRMRYGFIVPVEQADALKCFVTMGGYDPPDLHALSRPVLHMMAIYALTRAQELREPVAQPVPPLTDRERDVLLWSAAGKTARQIADLIAISERTVVAHANSAVLKLGAKSRIHAVARALALHLIQL